MSTVSQKLIYSAIGAGLMLVIANPLSYKLGGKLFGSDGDCPSVTGHLANTLIFLLLLFVIMYISNMFMSPESKKSGWLLLKYSFYGALLFFIITNSEIYKLTGSFGGLTANADGCPTIIGLFVHAIVLFLLTFLVMYFPHDQCNCS